MKNRLIWFLVTLALSCTTVLAQVYMPEPGPTAHGFVPTEPDPSIKFGTPTPPALVLPSMQDITGYAACASNDRTIIGDRVTQDPTTLYWSGLVYGATLCAHDGSEINANMIMRRGCAIVRWDPTGTTYTVLKILWRKGTPGGFAHDCLPSQTMALNLTH
jgi:hypothetical protein